MACSESPSISVDRRGSIGGEADCTIVWVRGEHDVATKVSLAVTIARAAARDHANLLVDLSEVTFMDASIVGTLVGSRNRLRNRGQSLEVRAPSRIAGRVLELCGLDYLVHPSAVDPVHPAGAAAALSTWVDVLPVQPNEPEDHEAAPVVARPTVRPRERVLADVRIEKAAAAVDVDHRGP